MTRMSARGRGLAVAHGEHVQDREHDRGEGERALEESQHMSGVEQPSRRGQLSGITRGPHPTVVTDSHGSRVTCPCGARG